MEIALVYREIQQLLIKDENVTLPKVGRFAIVAKPATFLEDCTAILPPKKELLFSPISELGENYLCEPWQQELAGEIIFQLQHNSAFEVPGFGVFSQSEEGKVSFEVSPEFDYAPDSFSLESIALEIAEPVPAQEPVLEPAQEPVSAPAEVGTAPVNTPAKEESISHDMAHHQAQRQRWILYGLLAIIVVLIAILFIFLFRESFGEMIKSLLYSKEELEIIQKWSSR